MRRVALLLLVAALSTSCAATSDPVAEVALDVAADDVGASSSEPIPTGRAALEAAEGAPYVLWFWGAH